MKPCPFCGSSRLRIVTEGRMARVVCECTAQGPERRIEHVGCITENCDVTTDARIAWDERIQETKQ